MGAGPNPYPGTERRRHFRVDGEWPIPVAGAEPTGSTSEFEALARNISMSGILLETAVSANLWVDKPLTLTLPGGVGPTRAFVRRFIEYGAAGRSRTRWGIEFGEMTIQQRGLWARFVFSEAHRLGQGAAHQDFLRRTRR
jgi:PilZ domain